MDVKENILFLFNQRDVPGYVNVIFTYRLRLCFHSDIIYVLGWGDFLQKQASYCGNLGMTHKDEKWQK